MTLEELKKLYAEKGAMEQRVTPSEQGDIVDYIPIQYGDGWTAWDKAPVQIGTQGEGMDAQPIFDDKKQLGGFSKQEGDYVTAYDLNGNVVGRQKWNENMLKSTIKDLGPIAMAALTMGGGAGILGNSLFGLTGAGASAAGGALAGGVNAYGNDQNILKGALLGGVSGAGSAKLADILGADTVGQTFKNATVGDVTKAINFAKDPTLVGAANIASPYVTTNFNVGDTGLTTNDILKGVTTAQALGSGDYSKIFKAITGYAGNADSGGLTADEQAQRAANRETNRLNRIEDAVLNQPASDDGSTQGILDLISSMYPSADIQGMSEGDLAKFLEANLNDIQGSAELETLLKGSGQTTADEGTVNITGARPTNVGNLTLPTGKTSNIGDQGQMFITGNRDAALNDFLGLNNPVGDVTNNYGLDDKGEVVITDKKNAALDDFLGLNTPVGDITNNYGLTDEGELVITGKREDPYIPSLRTKDIVSDIKDIDLSDIPLIPAGDINDILQTITLPDDKKTSVVTKPVTTTTKPTTTTTTKTTEDLMASLGLGSTRVAPSQDPYANIKLMEELFGGDVGYKLRSLGAPKNLASSDMDALVKLLRG